MLALLILTEDTGPNHDPIGGDPQRVRCRRLINLAFSIRHWKAPLDQLSKLTTEPSRRCLYSSLVSLPARDVQSGELHPSYPQLREVSIPGLTSPAAEASPPRPSISLYNCGNARKY